MAYSDTVRIIRAGAVRACAALAIMASLPALAQQPEAQPLPEAQPPSEAPPASPQPEAAPAAQSPGSIWSTRSEPGTATDAQQSGDAAPLIEMTPDQIDMLQQIDSYLNTLINIQGQFIQTDHRNEEKHGRFYVKRPGRIRFDYRAPSKLRIVSDGIYLSIEDHDLNTVDKYPLNDTPIRLLLGEVVNLARDANILDMRQDESAVVVILQDKGSTASGDLQLYFKLPELELYEWVITDAQGLETRIQLADLVPEDEEKSDEFFQASAIELENIENN